MGLEILNRASRESFTEKVSFEKTLEVKESAWQASKEGCFRHGEKAVQRPGEATQLDCFRDSEETVWLEKPT